MSQWQPSSLGVGQEYWVTTNQLATATNPSLTMAFGIFNPPNSGKALFVHNLQAMTQVGSTFQIYKLTADPAFGTVLLPTNLQLGNPTPSVASCSCTPTGATASTTKVGTILDEGTTGPGPQTVVEQLAENEVIEILPGNGIALYPFVATAGNNWACNAGWTERPLSGGA